MNRFTWLSEHQPPVRNSSQPRFVHAVDVKSQYPGYLVQIVNTTSWIIVNKSTSVRFESVDGFNIEMLD